MSDQTHAKPARGTRPSNRRQLILNAAEELFYRNGFANVAMVDIAEAVAIGPSALYRHFPSKQDLLAAVVGNALDTTGKMLVESSPQSVELAANIATSMLEHRSVGMLWRREARSLAPDNQVAIRDQVRDIGTRLASMIRTGRPDTGPVEADLLAWCVLGVATSISFHRLQLPDAEYHRLFGSMVLAVLDANIPKLIAGEEQPEPLPGLERSRREAILTAAARMFAEKGYANVGIEDIGTAAGIAGPSVYNHFDRKADILTAAMMRGDEWLRVDMNRTLARASSNADGVRRLLTSYCEFAFEHPELVHLLITETMQLPRQEQQRMRAAQYEYLLEWVRLVRAIYPNWGATSSRIRVQAVINMINDIALTGHLHRYRNLNETLIRLGELILQPL